MAHTHLAHPNLALDYFSGTDLHQNAESFIQLIERKINFALSDAPADPNKVRNYTFRNNVMFSSLLRCAAAEWYENTITNATTWENVQTNFITGFSNGRNKFRYRMELELCIRGNGEEIRYFLHRIKQTVDRDWPDDMNGIEAAQQNEEREAQGRHRRQKYIDHSLKGLRPRYPQNKHKKILKKTPYTKLNDFSTRTIQIDVSF